MLAIRSLTLLLCFQSAAIAQSFPIEIQGIWKTTKISSEGIDERGKFHKHSERYNDRAFCILSDRFLDIYDIGQVAACIANNRAEVRSWAESENKIFVFLDESTYGMLRYRMSVTPLDADSIEINYRITRKDGTWSNSRYKLERFSNLEYDKLQKVFQSCDISQQEDGSWIKKDSENKKP